MSEHINVLDRPLAIGGHVSLMHRLVRSPGALTSGAILLAFAAIALFAPLLAPHDPYVQDISRRLLQPIGYARHDPVHLLGTDAFGRDYLSRLIYGTRVALIIGVCVMLLSGILGTTLGMIAGFYGGRIDQILMFVINTRLALPVFLVAMAVVVVFGASLLVTILILGLFQWDRFVIVARSATQQSVGLDYVQAARAIGASGARILATEILPNILDALIVIATIEMAYAILLESALSFLGFGVQEPTASWGLMLAQARQYMFFDAWLLYIPGLALLILVLAINVFGDSLRDLLGRGNGR
ncbi:ABC transporter permease [Mesorhizobium sp. M0830]|uniref:ABC transporter permease n=1 Tax=Mesorhizobium sp. M0830 TaxID=2957008 RepID=UPI00333CE9C9